MLLLAFIALNWFARQPYSRQQELYSRLNNCAYLSYKLYYFSNASASITDSLGITGRDSVVRFKGELPVEDLMAGGYPRSVVRGAIPKEIQYFKRTGFTVCYAPELRHPLWVGSKVHDRKRMPGKKRPPFKRDSAAKNSPDPSDYKNSGYDRGHMAPNHAITTCYGKKAQKETFLLSNICPQKPALNRGPWRSIEHIITDIWPGKYGDIWVLTGAHTSAESKRLASGINIPDGFYKIILSKKNDTLRVLTVYMEQECGYNVFVRTRIISVDELEKITGIDFLSLLPDETEAELEAQLPTRLWPADLKGNLKLLISHFRADY